MDHTMQRNVGLVDETAKTASSMKEQAKELLRQVEVFKAAGAGNGRDRRDVGDEFEEF
jgi:hypothetical protein